MLIFVIRLQVLTRFSYLNGKCEEEGLYRVSGGVTDIRKWRRRFDTGKQSHVVFIHNQTNIAERDINLLDEADLYDASVIASLFKEWIRELPEEIFPKELQQKVAANLPAEPGRAPVPQAFRDELASLPPFNYYLLFAITCHLSLLISHKSENKMTLDNLYRCFNQSLKLDGRVFYTLVGDWRQCWQDLRCAAENEYLRTEYEYLQTPFPHYPDHDLVVPDDKAVASSSSSLRSGGDRTPTVADARPSTAHAHGAAAADDTGDSMLSPGRKAHRSSSDVTGASPLKLRNTLSPH